MNGTFTYVIVGGGIAGVSCVEQISSLCDRDDCILLITASSMVKIATNLKHITESLTDFDVQEADATTWSQHYKNLTIQYGLVTRADLMNKRLEVDNRNTIKFKKLCICAGGLPKNVCSGNDNVITIRDTESVQRLQSIVQASKRLMVIGNGGIATELVNELQNIEIIWSIKDKSITHKFLDAGAAEFLLKKMSNECSAAETKHQRYTIPADKIDSKYGVAMGPDWHKNLLLTGEKNSRNLTIEFGTEVLNVTNSESDKEHLENKYGKWPVFVTLTNGKVWGCDVVISATGVSPNCEVWKMNNPDLNISDDGGIDVDENMMTSIPDVYAAGDVCTAKWPTTPHWQQMRLWVQARQMGAFAAKCMYHHNMNHEKIPLDFCFEIFTHVTRFFNTKVVLLGCFNAQNLNPEECHALVRVKPGNEYIKLIIANGKMQGALLIGETNLEETFENLILNQIDLTPYGEDLLNPCVDIEDYFD